MLSFASPTRRRLLLQRLAWLCAALMLVVASLSAFIRQSRSEQGCEPWPQCQGIAAVQVGEPVRVITMDLAREGEEPAPRYFVNPEILGTTAMEADQKLDENRLQFKLAAAEARDAAAQLSPKEAAEAMRRKADEARDAARRASEISRLNAAEAAKAVKLAAKGTAERTAELLQLEQLAEELAARSEELRARTRRTAHFGKGRMLRAYQIGRAHV